MQRVATSACRLKRDLHRVAQFGLHAQHGGQRASAERDRAEIARALNQPLERRAVGKPLLRERLGERSGVGVLEQADAHRVEPLPAKRRDSRFGGQTSLPGGRTGSSEGNRSRDRRRAMLSIMPTKVDDFANKLTELCLPRR